MATTLPTLTQTIDNAFVTTWYEIKPQATDNILNATVLWAALNAAGCMVQQTGGQFITRTIRYGTLDAAEVQKGDTLPQGDPELETMALWNWRYLASHVQRNAFDDQKNNGPAKIKDLVQMKLGGARDGLEALFETSLTNATVTAETGKKIQGLNDIIPLEADRSSGTYGGINRPLTYSSSSAGVTSTPATGNTWWGAKYRKGTLANIEDDLLSDMKSFYNSVHNNQSPPNLLVSDQATFEVYEEFALDMSQIIKDEGTRLADLGFEVLRFKGKPLIWASGITANHMLFLNTAFMELVYDPNMWFDMTEWKPVPLQADRIAHIMCAANLVATQLRRFGRLYYA